MHQWYPDELPTAATAAESGSDVHVEDEDSLAFIEDHPQKGPQAFLQRLDEEERAALYELVEKDIRAEITERMQKDFEVEMQSTRTLVEEFGRAIRWAIDEELSGLAQGALQLALAVGERLARQAIAVDERHLIRVIEGIIGETEVGADLKVIANPRCIERLKPFMKELTDLNVNKLIPDVSLAPSGCIVRANGQEWDLTFEGQFETLSTAVREAMMYGGTGAPGVTDVGTVEVVS